MSQPGPSGPGGNQIGGLLDGKPVGVDTQSAGHGVFQGFGPCYRRGSDSEQVSGGLSRRRVARLRPAATLSAEHDPPRQLTRSGVQSAQRDGRAGERVGVRLRRGFALDRADRDQALGPAAR